MKDIILPIVIALLSSAGFWALIGQQVGKRSAVHQALGALLRHEMFDIYEEYKDAPCVPADILEEIDSLHSAYKSLGYNHLGDKIWEEIMKKSPC